MGPTLGGSPRTLSRFPDILGATIPPHGRQPPTAQLPAAARRARGEPGPRGAFPSPPATTPLARPEPTRHDPQHPRGGPALAADQGHLSLPVAALVDRVLPG